MSRELDQMADARPKVIEAATRPTDFVLVGVRWSRNGEAERDRSGGQAAEDGLLHGGSPFVAW